MKHLSLPLISIAVALLFFLPLYLPSDYLSYHYVRDLGWQNSVLGHSDDVDYWAVTIVTDTANQDSCYIYDALRASRNWNHSHIRLLSNEKATKSMILDSIDWLGDQADENDVVVFSFHGHGSHSGTILKGTYGIVPQDGGMITREELDEKFDMLQAGGVCLIFDCCLSGNLVDPWSRGGENDFFEVLDAFTCGLEGDNRVVLMSTLRYGLGFSDSINQIYFSRFVAEAFTNQADNNHDGFCSAEEAFNYSHDKFYPYAYEMLLFPFLQLLSFIEMGFFILAFPTLYDTYPGELPLVYL